MNSILKKIIIVIAVITIVTSFGSLFYLKSDFYLNKVAENKMQLKLKELNLIKRIYVNEGVYVYEQDVMEFVNEKDKFGNSSFMQRKIGVKQYEIAFTSERLVILDESKNRKEEIYFSKKYLVGVSEEESHYNLFIDKWLVKTIKTDELIEDILKTKGYEKPNISLIVKKDITPRFWSYNGFQITQGDVNLILHRNVSNYSLSFVPQYVSNARYADNIYDLKTYKE